MIHSGYWVMIKPQTNEQHAVHRDNCPFLPDDGKRLYLGEFTDGADALTAGKSHFHNTQCCRFCMPEYYQSENKSQYSYKEMISYLPTDSQLSRYKDGALFCVLN